jgi:hypothetical protein
MNGNGRRHTTAPRLLLGALAMLWAAGLAGAASAAEPRLTDGNDRLSRPRSHLHRSYDGPVFVFAQLGAGGSFQHDNLQYGYGGGIVFRPGSAAHFLDRLYDLDTGLVLQGDYQKVAADARLLSADGILRHYLDDRAVGESVEVRPFIGAGLGATDARIPASEGGGRDRYFSWLIEGGQEWVIDGRYLVLVRGQFRRYSHDGHNFSGWSLRVAGGIPLFW